MLRLFILITQPPDPVTHYVQPIAAGTRLAPLVQLRPQGEWSRIEFLFRPQSATYEGAKLEVRRERIGSFRLHAIRLNTQAAAAVINARVGPITLPRRCGERHDQRE